MTGAPKPGTCEHQTAADHSRVIDGVRIWRCSSCGREAPWSESWSYYGDIECARCWQTTIEWVACSPACVLPLPEGPSRPKTAKRQTGPRVRACSKCGKPVLFLDIDGVLNSADYLTAERCGRESWAEMLCPEMCARLERVLRETGAAIVLSTSWRVVHTAEQIEAWLRERGVPSARVIGRTPPHRETPGGVMLPGNAGRRGHEIQAWLNAHPCERFAVVDDSMIHGADPHELAAVVSRFVQTSWYEGMQDGHADELIAILREGLEPWRRVTDRQDPRRKRGDRGRSG